MSSRLAELVTPLYRGTVAPSTGSFLPTYQERSSSKPFASPQNEQDGHKEAEVHRPPGVDIAWFGLLEPVFRGNRGFLEIDRFVAAVIELSGLHDAKAAVKLFRGIDFLNEGQISWDAFSLHMITRKMNESNAGQGQNVHADISVTRTESLGANSGGVARLRDLGAIGRVAAMGVTTRHVLLLSSSAATVAPARVAPGSGAPGSTGPAAAVPLQSPDRCIVNDVCLVHETGQIALLGADHSVLLYDLSPMVLLRSRYMLTESQMSMVAVGRRLFVGAVSGHITEVNLGDGEITVNRECHEAEIYTIKYFPALTCLGSASADGKVRLWDLNAGGGDHGTRLTEPMVTLRGHRQAVMFLAFNHRHTLLITGGLDKDALVWNPYVEREPVSRLQGHAYALSGVGSRQSQIVTADVGGILKIWDARSFRPLFTLSVGTSLSCISVSKMEIVVGADNGKIFFIHSKLSNASSRALKCLALAISTHTERIFAATTSSIYVYTFDGKLRKRFPLTEISSPLTALIVTPNGRAFVTGHIDGQVVLFSAATGEAMSLSPASMENGEVTALVATDAKVVMGTSRGLVRVIQLTSHDKCEVRVEYFRHLDAVTKIWLSPDEHLVISAGRDALLAVFNLKELRQGLALRPTEEALVDVVPVDGCLRVCDCIGTVVTYEVNEGQLLEVARRPTAVAAHTVRAYGVIRGVDYQATSGSQLVFAGDAQDLPGVARQICGFRGDQLLLMHMQDGHVLITDPKFEELMYLGNALPLSDEGKSRDELEIEESVKLIRSKSLAPFLLTEKPPTPFQVSPSQLQLPTRLVLSNSEAFERLASSKSRVETLYRLKKLPADLAEANRRVADALYDAGMDPLHLFDCNPRTNTH